MLYRTQSIVIRETKDPYVLCVRSTLEVNTAFHVAHEFESRLTLCSANDDAWRPSDKKSHGTIAGSRAYWTLVRLVGFLHESVLVVLEDESSIMAPC